MQLRLQASSSREDMAVYTKQEREKECLLALRQHSNCTILLYYTHEATQVASSVASTTYNSYLSQLYVCNICHFPFPFDMTPKLGL